MSSSSSASTSALVGELSSRVASSSKQRMYHHQKEAEELETVLPLSESPPLNSSSVPTIHSPSLSLNKHHHHQHDQQFLSREASKMYVNLYYSLFGRFNFSHKIFSSLSAQPSVICNYILYCHFDIFIIFLKIFNGYWRIYISISINHDLVSFTSCTYLHSLYL